VLLGPGWIGHAAFTLPKAGFAIVICMFTRAVYVAPCVGLLLFATSCQNKRPPASIFIQFFASGDCTSDPVLLKPGRPGVEWAAILADDLAKTSIRGPMYAVGTDAAGAQCAKATVLPAVKQLHLTVQTFTNSGELIATLRKDRPPNPFVIADVRSVNKILDALRVEWQYSFAQYQVFGILWDPDTGMASKGASPLDVADRKEREQMRAQETPEQGRSRSSVAAPLPERFTVSERVQSESLIQASKAVPTYPSSARAAGIQGTVKFLAVIGKDGHVVRLEPLSGDPLLVEAARDAVMKWEYRPTALDGVPVEVVTQIELTFTANGSDSKSSLKKEPVTTKNTSLAICPSPLSNVDSGAALPYGVAVGVPLSVRAANPTEGVAEEDLQFDRSGQIISKPRTVIPPRREWRYILGISDGSTTFLAELDLRLRDGSVGTYLVGEVSDSFKKAASCLSPGLTPITANNALAIDYVKQNLPEREFDRLHPIETPAAIKELIDQAIIDKQAMAFAVGRAGGSRPGSASINTENIISNIYMNQSAAHSGSERDGALIIRLSNNVWKAIYIRFRAAK
jgi:TonB family protein